MRLWLISQTENDDWDTYDMAVVAAETEEDARVMYPRNGEDIRKLISSRVPPFNPVETFGEWYSRLDKYHHGDWVLDPALITVRYLGRAGRGTQRGVICASFHAG